MTSELAAATHRLPDDTLDVMIRALASESEAAREGGDASVARWFRALCVALAEEQDRRAALAEHARQAMDGDERGGIVAPEDLPTMLDDARDELREPPS